MNKPGLSFRGAPIGAFSLKRQSKSCLLNETSANSVPIFDSIRLRRVSNWTILKNFNVKLYFSLNLQARIGHFLNFGPGYLPSVGPIPTYLLPLSSLAS